MSRSNPNKQKPRSAKHIVLIYGEGLGEKRFLYHLKQVYGERNSDISVRIGCGRGGTPISVILGATQFIGDFRKKVVILDNDRPEIEMKQARDFAAINEIELIENSPCLEFLFLQILESSVRVGLSSSLYKAQFERKYMDKDQRSEPKEYIKIFPKKLLDERLNQILILDRIIKLIRGEVE